MKHDQNDDSQPEQYTVFELLALLPAELSIDELLALLPDGVPLEELPGLMPDGLSAGGLLDLLEQYKQWRMRQTAKMNSDVQEHRYDRAAP
jgi:hypothetical protein